MPEDYPKTDETTCTGKGTIIILFRLATTSYLLVYWNLHGVY